ncbi:MAG: cob(I)yrinic acid a,c-diamide adenosyltransferase [Deltaproteobacteria bacterium]|nr:cob(I)yrinic acid a,c-diamide adenosyltransferase [Deltaproteobacteria bacterium]
MEQGNHNGRVVVLTGNGKGKTTTSLGLALAAAGRGKRVFMVQFIKGPESSGEHRSLPLLEPNLSIEPMGEKNSCLKPSYEDMDHKLARGALFEARLAMDSGEYDMLVLDEANVAVAMGLVDLDQLLEFIEAKPSAMELVITGRWASPLVADRADRVIEMRKVKHTFDHGGPATRGIEF